MLTWHLYPKAGWRMVAGSDEERRWRGWPRAVQREGTDITCGACVSVREEREGESGQWCNIEGKAYSIEYAKGAWATWAGEGCSGLRRGASRREANWSGSQGKIQMELIFECQMNLEFGKTLKNFTRGLRRNLDTRIFPKFFWASQGFLENKICHNMICILSPN
jgi:hypothetical protein